MLIIGVAILIPAAILARMIYWAYTAEPDPRPVSAQLMAIAAEGQPEEGENAWPMWMEAAELLGEVTKEINERHQSLESPDRIVPDFFHFFHARPDKDVVPELDAIEALRARGVFDLMERAAAAPRVVRMSYPGGAAYLYRIDADLGWGNLRRLLIMRSATFRWSARNDDWTESIQALRQMVHIATAAELQPTEADHLIAVAMRLIVWNAVSDVLVETRPPREVLDAFEATLNPVLTISTDRVVRGLRAAALIMMDHFYDGEEDGGRFIPTAVREWERLRVLNYQATMGTTVPLPSQRRRISNLIGWFTPGREEVEAFIVEVFDEVAGIAAAHHDSFARVTAGFPSSQHDERLMKEFGWPEPVFEDVWRAVTYDVYTPVRTPAMRLIFAIERYQRDHGGYPQSLEALTPEYLETLPTDPSNGMGFGYQFPPTASFAIDQPYLLYSFGPDGQDDGGRIDSWYDNIEVPPAGNDLIINHRFPAESIGN